MGLYLNSKKPYTIYKDVVSSTYFVDKTAMLGELIPLVEPVGNETERGRRAESRGNKYICLTRPRRFGKTLAASMIASFFGRGRDARGLFERLQICRNAGFERHLNRHDVIYIAFNEAPAGCADYRQYIDRIQERLVSDLMREYPNAGIKPGDAPWDVLNSIYELEQDIEFIFVLDEWDYIFYQDFVTDSDKKAYTGFLSALLKDQPYVELAYMTGILPIAKHSSGSELNMFYEYTMATEEKYSEFFGFTDGEVDGLYAKYRSLNPAGRVSRRELRIWYDGYHIRSGGRVYNPRSVVASLTNNNLGSYWTSAGPYDEIFYYIRHNTDAVREDIARMVSGAAIPARVREYAAVSMNLSTRDEIFSAMVVYGFLSYENGYVSIPNRELMDQFDGLLMKEASLGYLYRLSSNSERMLKATREGDTDTMLEILEYAHNTEIPLLNYNNETDLTAIVNLVYLSARNTYEVIREDKGGKGYVDFIFRPYINRADDGIILELKIDGSAQEAIRQIKDRQYALAFAPKTGAPAFYTGRILAVGIAYDRETKKHSCVTEVLKDR